MTRVLTALAVLVAALAPPLVMAAVLAWANDQPKLFESETTLVVAPSPELADDPRASLDATNLLRDETAVATLAELAENQTILSLAAGDIGLTQPPDIDVSTATPPTSAVVIVTVTGENAALARDLVQAVAFHAVATFEETYPVLAVRTLGVPELDQEGSRISLQLAAAVGFVLGSVISWLVMAFRAHLRQRFLPPVKGIDGWYRQHPGQAS